MHTPAVTTRVGHGASFADSRAVATRAEAEQQVRAARLVATNSIGVDDCRELLSMLGLADPPAARPTLP